MYITILLILLTLKYFEIKYNCKNNTQYDEEKMRIISGLARGTKLYTLEGENTRPTLDRVKEPLFSIIQTEIKDSIVLDLFAGSGALGLEALSRGAKKAVLCDNSNKAIQIINKNLKDTRLEEKAKVINILFPMHFLF